MTGLRTFGIAGESEIPAVITVAGSSEEMTTCQGAGGEVRRSVYPPNRNSTLMGA